MTKQDKDIDLFSFVAHSSQLTQQLLESLTDYLNKTLSVFQLRIIMTIAAEKTLTVSDLSRRLQMNYGNTSSQCSILEERKYIKRRKSNEDRRKVYLLLDKDGVRTINAINYFKTTFLRTLSKQYTEAEWKKLTQQMNNLSNMIEQAQAVLLSPEHKS